MGEDRRRFLGMLALGLGGLAWPALRGSASPGAGPRRNVKLWLAGDVMTGRGIDQILRHSVDPVLYESHVRDANRYIDIAEETGASIPRDAAPSYIWGDALSVLADLKPHQRIINLETAVTTSDDPWPGKGIHYRMHPANVDVLTAADIDCCVLANNHVLDWGHRGLKDTLSALGNAGLAACGAGTDSRTASGPAALALPGGRRLLVFGAAAPDSGVPMSWAAGPGTSGVNLISDFSRDSAERLAGDIGSVRQPGDRVVVSIHWGGNWGYDIPREHRRFAHWLIEDAAVDVIHGHSSHHPKGIETHRGKLILYGCGDLINDYEGIGGRRNYRPELTALYLPELEASTGQFRSMTIVPMVVKHFRLNRTTDEETDWLAERLREESPGTAVERAGDRLVLRAR